MTKRGKTFGGPKSCFLSCCSSPRDFFGEKCLQVAKGASQQKKLFWARKVVCAFQAQGPKVKRQIRSKTSGAQNVVFQARATNKVRCQNKTFGDRKVFFQTRAFLLKLANALCMEHCKRFAQVTQRSNSSCLSQKKFFTERIPFLVARKNPFQQSDPIFTPKSITRTKSNFYQTV